MTSDKTMDPYSKRAANLGKQLTDLTDDCGMCNSVHLDPTTMPTAREFIARNNRERTGDDPSSLISPRQMADFLSTLAAEVFEHNPNNACISSKVFQDKFLRWVQKNVATETERKRIEKLLSETVEKARRNNLAGYIDGASFLVCMDPASDELFETPYFIERSNILMDLPRKWNKTPNDDKLLEAFSQALQEQGFCKTCATSLINELAITRNFFNSP